MNPIKTVNGVEIPQPDSYQWAEQDISASDAGRTEDTVMHKNRIGQTQQLQLEWKFVPISDAAVILKAFDPEYFTVEYLDAKAGGYISKEFYVGDRSAPLYNADSDRWESITFNLIARSGK